MLGVSKVLKFYNQVVQEAKKISWPTRKEISIIAIMVLISVVVSSLFILFSDFVIVKIINFLLSL